MRKATKKREEPRPGLNAKGNERGSVSRSATSTETLLALYGEYWAMQLVRLTSAASNGRDPGKRVIDRGWKSKPDIRRMTHTSALSVAELLAIHVEAGGNVGLAIPVGVVVLDADTSGAAEYLDQLAPAAPRQDTARGAHFWFRLPPGVKVANRTRVEIDNGIHVDVKSHGGQCVVEPSIHASGFVYEWQRTLPDTPADLPLLPEKLLQALGGTREPRDTREPHEASEPYETEATPQQQLELRDIESDIAAAIAETLPARHGERHCKLFEFGRRLKAILGDVPVLECRIHVVEWHRQALPFIHTKPFEDSWTDFLIAWPRIRFAYGESLDVLVERALARPDPAALDAARVAGLGSPHMLKLAALCFELARARDFKPFRLSVRLAARSIKCNEKTAHRGLLAFVSAGVLRLVERGEQHEGGKPSVYDWAVKLGE